MKNNNVDIVKLEEKIKKLKQDDEYEEALKLCNIKNTNIQLHRVKILMILGQRNNNIPYLKEALDICVSYSTDYRFQEKVPKLQDMVERYDPISREILTKIYFDYIDISEIQSANIDEWNKEILTIAWYDKKKDKKALSLIKTLKNKYCDDKEKIKILNILYNKIVNKKHLFDLTCYENIIGCYINFEMQNEVKEKVEDKLKTTSLSNSKVNEYANLTNNQVNNNELKQESDGIKTTKSYNKVVSPSIISFSGIRNNSRYFSNNNQNISNNMVTTSQDNLLIKDIFPSESLAICKYLYVKMNDTEHSIKAIEAWDKFEVLINKSASDKVALSRMIDLLKRIQNKDQTINPNYNYEKYQKLLSKN